MRHRLLVALIVGIAFVGTAQADTIGVLEQLTPSYAMGTLGIGGDWLPMQGSALGEVTGTLQAIDLILPPGIPVSTSGCEASDFVAFVGGNMALLQRGTCTFALKATNAYNAGALAVLVFNEGNLPTRQDVIFATMEGGAPILGAFLSFDAGEFLAEELSAGAVVTLHLRIDDATDPATVVPEPASLLLLGTGLVGLARWRKRRQ